MDIYTDEHTLVLPGYEVYFTRFADSIIKDHFKEAMEEISTVLNGFYIPEGDIIKGGGGRSATTKALEALLKDKRWTKRNIESTLKVGNKTHASNSHEIDHYRSFPKGSIGLEIEWNSKDTSYDRDLENFKKWHQIGEMSLGIIITRGTSLHSECLHVYERFLDTLQPFDFPTVSSRLKLSDAAKEEIEPLFDQPKVQAVKAIAKAAYTSKFATSTTHMGKLLEKIGRGGGDPCPFILIGIGKERLITSTF